MSLFVDAALARRLERAEGAVGASFVEARNRLDAHVRAESREVRGAFLSFDGADSPITQTFGLGMSDTIATADLDAIEHFFFARGAPVSHEICPLAGIDLTSTLADRGYRPIEMSNVLVRPIDGELASSSATCVYARRALPNEGDAWVDAAVRGWAEDAAFADLIRSFTRVAFANRSLQSFCAEIDGAMVATGSLGVFDGIALLAGASTVPSARNRGAQRALLAARLDEAQRLGCSLAMMVASPGSTSQRNAERNGYRVAYTRTKWQRALAQA